MIDLFTCGLLFIIFCIKIASNKVNTKHVKVGLLFFIFFGPKNLDITLLYSTSTIIQYLTTFLEKKCACVNYINFLQNRHFGSKRYQK